MNLIDRYNPTGKLELWVYKNGEFLEYYSDSNMILDVSRLNLAHLLGGHADGYAVTDIGFGTNPNGPTTTDTALTGSTVKALSSITYPVDNKSVAFNFVVAQGDMIGMDIREFGLLTSTGVLAARKTRGAFVKDSTISFNGTWTLTF